MYFQNCLPTPTQYENLYDQAFLAVKPDIEKKIAIAETASIAGNRPKAQYFYNRINDWYYLIYLCIIMTMDVNDARNTGDITVTLDSLWKKYDIKCIVKKFACHGMNANLVLTVFGFCDTCDDGISIMAIDDEQGKTPFTIHPLSDTNP